MFALPPPGYARTEGDTILLTGVGDNVAAAAADGLLVVLLLVFKLFASSVFVKYYSLEMIRKAGGKCLARSLVQIHYKQAIVLITARVTTQNTTHFDRRMNA